MHFIKKIINILLFSIATLFAILTIYSIASPIGGKIDLFSICLSAIISALFFYFSKNWIRDTFFSMRDKKAIAAGTNANNKQYMPKDYTFCLSLISGIDLPERTLCKIRITSQDISFSYGNTNFSLHNEKICNVKVSTDVQRNTQLVSSAGGALAGGALFGIGGALIGGRTKKKRFTEIKSILIISYIKDGVVANILFDANNGNLFTARKIEKIYRKYSNSEKITINL